MLWLIYGTATAQASIRTTSLPVSDRWAHQQTTRPFSEVSHRTDSVLHIRLVRFTGQQVTSLQGVATFKTVYPGWYRGRATHMHIKVHIGAGLKSVGGVIHSTGGHVSHTGQLYFEDGLTDAVATFQPYSSQTIRRTRNEEDGIFGQGNGASMIIPIRILSDEFTGGMAGEIAVGVDPLATPSPVGPGNGGGPRPPPPFASSP